MNSRYVARMGFVLTLVAAATACQGDGATAPAAAVPPVRLEVVNPAVTAGVLTRTTPLAADSTVSKTLGVLGGTITAPGGLRVVVPRFALASTTTITVTALKGNIVAYEFGPHGTTFRVPLEMTQDLHGTSAEGNFGAAASEIGYFADRSELDYTTRQARISEFLPIGLRVAAGTVITYQVRHFSGYVIVTGRNPNP